MTTELVRISAQLPKALRDAVNARADEIGLKRERYYGYLVAIGFKRKNAPKPKANGRQRA